MAETYALHEGAFGRAVVLELRDDLVAHAHAETQLALWLGGARVEAHVGPHLVQYGEARGTGHQCLRVARCATAGPQRTRGLSCSVRLQTLARRAACGQRPAVLLRVARCPDRRGGARRTAGSVLDKIVSPHQHPGRGHRWRGRAAAAGRDRRIELACRHDESRRPRHLFWTIGCAPPSPTCASMRANLWRSRTWPRRSVCRADTSSRCSGTS